MNKELYSRLLKKTLKMSSFLQSVPFIRAIILTGSMADKNIKESSDIDLLIIAKHGRIFTVRFFVNLIGILSWQKRPRDEKKDHAGKFCFNYFLSDNYLKIGYAKEREQYCAQNYGNSILIWQSGEEYEKFIKVNQDLLQIKNNKPQLLGDSVFRYFRKTSEIFLSAKLGNWLEKRLKNFQIKKIENDPITARFPDNIVYNDNELRFHPPKSAVSNKQ